MVLLWVAVSGGRLEDLEALALGLVAAVVIAALGQIQVVNLVESGVAEHNLVVIDFFA